MKPAPDRPKAQEVVPTADGARYIARIEGLIGDRDPVAILEATLNAASRVLGTLRIDEHDRPEAPGRWSARDVVLHLVDAETVYAERLRIMLSVDGVVAYSPYDQEQRLARLRAIGATAIDALSDFRRLRGDSLRWIETVAPADHERTGIHPTRGRETVSQLIRRWAGHDLVHLAQLARIGR